MGDAESLLLALGVIYLLESLVWLRPGGVIFSSWWGTRFRVRYPGQLLGNHRGSLFLAPPLPPLGTVFLGNLVPVSVSPTRLLAYAAHCLDPAGRPVQAGICLEWDGIREIQLNGRAILVDGQPFVRGTTLEAARVLYGALKRIHDLGQSEPGAAAGRREARIKKWMRESLDEKRVRARWQDYCERSRLLRLQGNVLFFFMFGLSPWLVQQYGMIHMGGWLVGGLLLQTMMIAWGFRKQHKELYPADEDGRFKHFLTMLLMPPAAIRAPEILGRSMMEKFHVLVLGKVLFEREAFRGMARKVLADLAYPCHPVHPFDSTEGEETERWYREALLETIRGFVKAQGEDPEALASRPVPVEEGNRSYCPRCFAQYETEGGRCQDCGGRPLESLG